MKSLYILTVVMFTGLLMMTVASYKVMTVARQEQQQKPIIVKGVQPATPLAARRPDLMPYVMASYIGLTLFVVGGLGALFAAFRAMTHRF